MLIWLFAFSGLEVLPFENKNRQNNEIDGRSLYYSSEVRKNKETNTRSPYWGWKMAKYHEPWGYDKTSTFFASSMNIKPKILLELTNMHFYFFFISNRTLRRDPDLLLFKNKILHILFVDQETASKNIYELRGRVVVKNDLNETRYGHLTFS